MEIKSGAKGDLVQVVQKKLLELDMAPGVTDGIFGTKTTKALTKYQKLAGLKADGIVGEITASALGLSHYFNVPELERRRFKSLLISNPNYFGNYPDNEFSVVKQILKNPKYEDISCIGFNPDTNILAATVQVKLPYGYGGNQCRTGTMEHIRFYIDYGDGWQDVGLGGVKVWDLPNADDCADKPNKPLSYVVSIEIEPEKKYCATPVLPRVRAILSWEMIPPDNAPDWLPSWGNVVERDIQIKPKPWYSFIPVDFVLPEYLEVLEKLPKIPELNPVQIPVPPLPPVEFKPLAKLYTSKKFIKKSGVAVEPGRFGHSMLKMVSGTSLPEPGLISAVLSEWNDLKLDLSDAIKQLDKTTADISYEELECIGLDPNRDWLEATFKIKKSAGYSGSLCQAGSKEYVAFWADWDDSCEWTYLDTVEVNTYDIPDIPVEGLNYTAYLPVDLDAIRRHCNAPKIARIRAVLSWNQPPSTTDPDNLRHYGNREDTHVQIRPAAAKALIERIGGVSVSQIDYIGNGKTIIGAQMMPSGALADHWGAGLNTCPFGGSMYIVGKQFNDGKYRLKVRPMGNPGGEEIVKSKFWITKGLNPPVLITPDPSGFVNYTDVFNNHDDRLGTWGSGDNNGVWEIMLERVRPDSTVVYTPWYKILLDNIEAKAEISLDGGACKTFSRGSVVEITGKFVASDELHFAGFKLNTLPTSESPPAPQTPGTASSSSGSWTTGRIEAPSPGGRVWSLDVNEMDPCGYVVEVRAYDQTIRNNHSNAHTYARADIGFCLIE